MCFGTVVASRLVDGRGAGGLSSGVVVVVISWDSVCIVAMTVSLWLVVSTAESIWPLATIRK